MMGVRLSKLQFTQQLVQNQPRHSGKILPLESWSAHDIGEINFPCVIGCKFVHGSTPELSSRYLEIQLERPLNKMFWVGLLLRNPTINLEGEILSNGAEGSFRVLLNIEVESACKNSNGELGEFKWISGASSYFDLQEGEVNLQLQNGSMLLNWENSPEEICAFRIKIAVGLMCIEGTDDNSVSAELRAKLQPGEVFSQVVASNDARVLLI